MARPYPDGLAGGPAVAAIELALFLTIVALIVALLFLLAAPMPAQGANIPRATCGAGCLSPGASPARRSIAPTPHVTLPPTDA